MFYFQSNILTLGVTVDPRIKAKIWAGQYVELASLHSVVDQRPALAVAWEGDQPHLAVAPPRHAAPSNVTEWQKLFLTYAAIYVEAHPTEAAALMTYAVRVVDLYASHRGFLWRAYDERFRRLRAVCTTLPWNQLNWHLVMELTGAQCQSETSTSSSQPSRAGTAGTAPAGACRVHFYKGVCTRQKYTHICSICGKSGHSATTCRSPDQSGHNDKKPGNNASHPQE